MKTAIITGASRGLGRATAGELVDKGWRVIIDARTASEIESEADAIGAIAVTGDVSNDEHLDDLIAATDGHGIDLLVNNASILGPSPQPHLSEYPLDTLRNVFEVNLLAPVGLIQKALPHLRETAGTIVNITSDAAVQGYEGWGGYGATKAALEQVSNVLAAEEPSIRVYWVDPGDMNTRMHQDAFPGEDISDRPLPESRVPGLIRLIENAPPSGRYVLEDLLAAVGP